MKLLPCPFCGGEAAVEREGTTKQSHQITCEDCQCSLETGETGNMRGEAWNTRTPAPTVWHRASEKLPTEADVDYTGSVWVYFPESMSNPVVSLVTAKWLSAYVAPFFWTQTHFTKPKPPEV